MPARYAISYPIEQRMLQVILRHNAFAMIMGLLFGAVVVTGLFEHVSPLRLYGWFAMLVVVVVYRSWVVSVYSGVDLDSARIKRAARHFSRGQLATGLVWAALPWLAAATDPSAQLFIAVMMTGILAGATAALALNPRYFVLFTFAPFVSLCAYLLLQPSRLAVITGVMLILFYAVMYKGIGLVGKEVRDYLRMRFDADLQREGIERQAAELAAANAANLRRRELLEGLLRIATLRDVEPLHKLDRLLEFGCNVLGLRVGAVAEIRNGERRVFARHDPGKRDVEAVVAPDTSLCMLTLETEAPFHFANAAEARDRLGTGYAGDVAGAYIGARIHTSEGVFGTVNFHDTIARRASFTETELDFVRLLAGWIGAELSEHFVQRRLRIKEQQLSSLADAMPCGMAALDADGRILYANRLFNLLFNSDERVLSECELKQLLDMQADDTLDNCLAEAIAGEAQEFEYATTTHEGKRIYRISLVPNVHEGEQAGCFVLTLDITEDKALQSELELKASLDPLTRIYNRKYLEDELESILSDRRRRKPVYVALLDLDGFKQVNDSAGHDAGDAILREVAATLRKGLRKNDLLARYGGDEFVALLHCVDDTDLKDTCEKMLAQVGGRTYQHGGVDYRIGMSIGATRIRRGEAMHHLLVRADSAMYLAKRRGRNRIEIVSPNDTAVTIRNRSA